ncbi:hypothetical protein [Pseudonocardia kunmingensis]|uniref:hypothetical protein n=1 Tax=Pseudonocardia kunmingensis TaxID=630975 RepID=UPI00115280F6|nr:hypothetical protein [Pseudonocardia kunmingensis]
MSYATAAVLLDAMPDVVHVGTPDHLHTRGTLDGPAPGGIPLFADGPRAVRTCEAVLASAASDSGQQEPA